MAEPMVCHEEVSRKGELQPCDKPACAVRIHDGGRYPVCAYHARGQMVSLDELFDNAVTEGLGLKSLTVEGGVASLSFTTSGIAERTVLVMLDGLADMLDDATNYVEFDLRRRGKMPVSVCVRRFARPTPHELRVKAEQERDAALAELARLKESRHA